MKKHDPISQMPLSELKPAITAFIRKEFGKHIEFWTLTTTLPELELIYRRKGSVIYNRELNHVLVKKIQYEDDNQIITVNIKKKLPLGYVYNKGKNLYQQQLRVARKERQLADFIAKAYTSAFKLGYNEARDEALGFLSTLDEETILKMSNTDQHVLSLAVQYKFRKDNGK